MKKLVALYKQSEAIMESYSMLKESPEKDVIMTSIRKILEQIHELILKDIKET